MARIYIWFGKNIENGEYSTVYTSFANVVNIFYSTGCSLYLSNRPIVTDNVYFGSCNHGVFKFQYTGSVSYSCYSLDVARRKSILNLYLTYDHNSYLIFT